MSFQFYSRIQTLTFPSLPFLPFKPNFIQLAPLTHIFPCVKPVFYFQQISWYWGTQSSYTCPPPLLKPTQTNSKCWIIVLSSPCANQIAFTNVESMLESFCPAHRRSLLKLTWSMIIDHPPHPHDHPLHPPPSPPASQAGDCSAGFVASLPRPASPRKLPRGKNRRKPTITIPISPNDS